MPTLSYHLVDVFTSQPFGGNQLAVFLDADTLPAELMQTIARELNLSETAFVLSSTVADFRVRFFTPAMELPMAGHPTVGTAFVLNQLNRLPPNGSFTFEEGVGIIPVARSGSDVFMRQASPQFGPVLTDREAVAELLSLSNADLLQGYPIQVVSSGVPFTYIPVVSLEAVRRAQLRRDVWASLLEHSAGPHVFVFTTETEDRNHAVHARMFAPLMGISEDPATGAASGPLGAYLVNYGLTPAGDGIIDIISEQGYEIGRPSQIKIRIEPDWQSGSGILVGGTCVSMGAGQLFVPAF